MTPRASIVRVSSLYSELYRDCTKYGIPFDQGEKREEIIIRSSYNELDQWKVHEFHLIGHSPISRPFRHYLLGAWVKEDTYLIDRSGHRGLFALVYSLSTNLIYIEWSKLTTKCGQTTSYLGHGQPCGDLDTPGDTLAYTLPDAMFKWSER